jgi:hypothetical protein
MVIWSGFGFLVGLIWLATLVGARIVVDGFTGEPDFYSTHRWPTFVAYAIAAGIVWPLGRAINRKRPESEVIEMVGPDTQRSVVTYAGGGHSFFFIPIEYWAPIFLVAGIFFALR